MPSNDMIILHPDAKGRFDIPAGRGDIQRVDIADVDLVVTTKAGTHYLLAGAGIAAMSDNPPAIEFSNGTLTADQLIGEVGAVLDVQSAIPTPSSIKLEGADTGCGSEGGKGGDQQGQGDQAHAAQAGADAHAAHGAGAQGCEVKTEQQQEHQSQSQSQVSTLTVNTEASVEQLVQQAQKVDQDLHSHDYDYVPPQEFQPPPNPLSPPAGVPPPISLTPLVNLFMGNVVGTTVSTTVNPGYTTYYGGGGAVNTDSTAQLGPRDALQFSAATITGDDGNDIIYAEGPLVGNTNPAISNSTYYTKQFILNVAGYFTSLNAITFSNVPTNVSIVGATNQGGGVWVLPSTFVLDGTPFTMVYNTIGATGTFDIDITISGVVARGVQFNSTQDFRFEYLPVTSTSQITDPSLVYDSGGLSREIYVLPTLDQPNIITAGDGNDIVYGSRSNDTITLGNGNDQVTDGSGTDVITLGTGTNAVTIGAGSDTIATGNGSTTLTISGGTLGTDTITLGTSTADTAANTIYVNSATGSTGSYDITLYGSGTQTVASQNGYAGDGNYTITMNGTGTLNIAVGAGADTITTYGNNATMSMGSSSDTSAHTVYINSTTGNTGLYTLTLNGTGTQTVAYQAGYAGDGDYDITMGGIGVHNVTIGNSTSNDNGTTVFDTTISVGAGTNTITTGNGEHQITAGAGSATITTGSGNDSITVAGGGGVINAGAGNNTITVNSTTGSTDTYTLTTTGTGTNTITGGDDLYVVNMGAGANTVTLGNGTNIFNTQITAGAGTNVITTGSGEHTVGVGTGAATINLGAGNNTITTAGGGGVINTAQGNQVIAVNSTSGSTNAYVITTVGTGNTNLTGGDDNYTLTLASGANTVSIGNGTSTVTATGAGVDSITTGNGHMTVTEGAGNADAVTIGSGTTAANTIAVSVGNGTGDSVTTYGSSGSHGTVAIGTGNNDTANIGLGNFTVTVGGSNGTTNTLSLAAGSGDSITAGAGNNTVYYGSHAAGTDTLTLGNGNNTVYVGTGTNTLTAGTGSNTLNFTNLASGVTATFSGNGAGTATGTGISDSFSGFSTIYGTNYGDTISLASTTAATTIHDGTGNDTITLGSGLDTIYASNGNNTVTGSNLTTSTGDLLYGGTGNNIFNAPDAGTTYNGTNGAALTAIASNTAYSFTNTTAANPFANATGIPSNVQTSYVGGVETVTLTINTQINEINYGSTSTTGLTINLSSGQGSGGNAAGSVYTFTPTAGYSTINEIIADNGTNILTPSFSNTILVGGNGQNSFMDNGTTVASQTNILIGNNTTTGNGTDYYYMGLANEVVVGSTHNGNVVYYQYSQAGVVVNLDSVSHTFSSSLFTAPLTVAAYTGTNWGADANGTAVGTTGANASSYSTGDYFLPVNGTATDVTQMNVPNGYDSVVYGGTNSINYYAPSGSGNSVAYFYAGSGGSTYQMNYGYAVADVLTAGGNNVFTVNTGYNMYVILNKALDTGPQSAKDQSISTTYGGTTYAGFAYGWNDVVTPVGNPLTYITGYENILGNGGNDYIVGDNNGNQINGETGTNTIILGDGTNIVTAIQGSNTITSSTGNPIGTNTLNFEITNDTYSGVMGGYSGSGNNVMVEAFLNYSVSSTQSTFFGTGGDETAFFASSALAGADQVRTGISSYSYSTVQSAIISVLNGSDYTSGTTNAAIAIGSASTSTNATFVYDNVYSGAKTIYGHAGSDIFIDNIGTAAETFNGSADTSNVYYATSSQIPDITIVGSSAHLNILRVEGWGATTPGTSGNAFGTTDPFSTTKITGVTEIDVRSGVDSVATSTNTITLGPNSTTNTLSSHPVFNLSSADIQNIVGTASTPTLILKLDNGETFQPTGTVSTAVSGNTTSYYNSATQNSTTLIATDTHTAANYYSDVLVYNTTNHATVQIHYGSG